jgi:hypothetical protein
MVTLQRRRRIRGLRIVGAAAAILAISHPARAQATAPAADPRPLSLAQIALFESPHLHNVTGGETLSYRFLREGADSYADSIAIHVRHAHPDGRKDLAFDYLSGPRHVAYPELDGFRGNPLLMLALEQDVAEMHERLGLSATWLRNRIREALVDRASITEASFALDGQSLPARRILLHPFADQDRLERLPSLRNKSYAFTLCDAVPGTLAEIRIEMPADPAAGAPDFTQRILFTGAQP